MPSTPEPAPAARMPDVQSKIDQLKSKVSNLGDQWKKLVTRLEPVLAVAPPLARDSDPNRVGGSAPLAVQLSDVNQALAVIVAELGAVLDRLEV
mgnify:CR=1 FL=1